MMISGAAPLPHVSGHLQVKAEVGVRVQISGTELIAEDSHGVTFRELTPGAHSLEALREGYVPQHALIWVRAGEVTVHRLAPWQKRVVAQGKGALVIQTLPVDATVSAQGLGYGKIAKGDAPLILPHVPAGRHKLTFCTDYKCMDYRAEVTDGQVVSLLVDFEPGEIHDLSSTFEAQVMGLTQGCLRLGDTDACKQACTLATRLSRPSPACEAAQGPAVHVDRGGQEATIPASSRRALP